jgi:hypothetical protein
MKTRSERLGGYRAGALPPNARRRAKRAAAGQSLPAKVDLRPFLTDVEEQVGYSCVANAFAGAYEYLAKRHLGASADVSRLFIYFNARYNEGDQDEDAGTTMQAAIDGLKEYGACHEDLWPNDEDAITEEPDENAYSQASQFKIADAEFVETDLDLWRQTLAAGYPIAFSLNTFTSFDDASENRGRVPVPKRGEQEREEEGWHAMLCVGYLDKDQMFIVRNSWGIEWGAKGYCYIPYRYMMHADLNGQDSWVIRAVDDLDFSREIQSDDDGSYFAEDGSIQLFDFFVATKKVEQFATALEKLCQQYVDDEDFYFDYEEDERDGVPVVVISNFDLSNADPVPFLGELRVLCGKWASDGNYNFTVEGVDAEEASDEAEADAGEDEDASEDTEGSEDSGALTLEGFFVYTDDAEKVSDKIDKLCEKHAAEDTTYGFEWAEEEDEQGAYVLLSPFEITPADKEAFLTALEALCEKLSTDAGYGWD